MYLTKAFREVFSSLHDFDMLELSSYWEISSSMKHQRQQDYFKNHHIQTTYRLIFTIMSYSVTLLLYLAVDVLFLMKL